MAEEKFFLGRQPILDREQQIVAFELLFRSADKQYADFTDQTQASASVILNAMTDFGIDNVVGRHKAFFNVNTDMLMSDPLELLPKDHVVIELLENIEITDQVIARCLELKEKGFMLAADDHTYSPEYEPLYNVIDVIKFDILLTPIDQLPEMMKQLNRWRFTFLAEKVETREQYDACHALGFELFQGYYFSRPVVLKQKRIDTARATLLKLLNQLQLDSDLAEIEISFRQNPNLIYGLLRLVNSVAFGLREKVRSLKHAIMVLGRQQLRRWVVLALYAGQGAGATATVSPLLELASVRGRLMEMLALQVPNMPMQDKEWGERAFMAGVLSLVDVLLSTTVDDVVASLNLTDDIRSALLYREGSLGILLQIAEEMEKAEFSAAEDLLTQVQLSAAQLASAQLETIAWSKGLAEYS
jgi:EAL and modified HD-GYP domain-containing signal transduction protein